MGGPDGDGMFACGWTICKMAGKGGTSVLT